MGDQNKAERAQPIAPACLYRLHALEDHCRDARDDQDQQRYIESSARWRVRLEDDAIESAAPFRRYSMRVHRWMCGPMVFLFWSLLVRATGL